MNIESLHGKIKALRRYVLHRQAVDWDLDEEIRSQPELVRIRRRKNQ
jgi:hypothetical protein